MHHGILRRRTPLGLKQIIGILGKSRRVNIAEIGIFGVIGGGFSDIVKPRPQKLPEREIRVPIVRNTGFHTARPPAGAGIAQSRTLLVLIRQHGLPQRKPVHPPALHHGGRLTAVYDPVRVLLMMLPIVLFPIIIPRHLHDVRTVLRALPGHKIGAYGDPGIAPWIVGAHIVHQAAGNLLAVGVRMGIINFISDGPQKKAGMIAVPANPGTHVPLGPLLKKPAIVIGRFAPLPHVKGLGQHQNAHLVRQLHHLLGGHVVAGAQGVDTHLFQYSEFPAHGFLMKSRSQASQVVMFTDSVDFHISAVEEKAPVRGKFHPAQAHCDLLAVQGRPAPFCRSMVPFGRGCRCRPCQRTVLPGKRCPLRQFCGFIIERYSQLIAYGMLQIPFLQALRRRFQGKADLAVLPGKSLPPAQIPDTGTAAPQTVSTPGVSAHSPRTLRLYLHLIAAFL